MMPLIWNGGGFSPVGGSGSSMPEFKHWWGYAIFIVVAMAFSVGLACLVIHFVGLPTDDSPQHKKPDHSVSATPHT